tara:strand:- start:423 stop:1370 length:948 start_codon:yes stop_codon:yes gene_type:complete
MATGKRLECKWLSSLFFVARRNEIHRIRALKPVLQSLVLTVLCLCAGCYSAGGKPVGLLAALRGSVEKPLSAKEISEQMQSSEKARGQLTKSGTVFQFERDIVIEDFDGKGNLKRRQTRRFKSFTDNRDPVLTMHDGKDPTPKQVEKERKKIRENQVKFLGGGDPTQTNAQGDADLLLRQIERYGDRFTPRLIGEETVHGRPAYILQFLFDPKKKFKDPLVNLVLKHLLIKAWVDQEEFQVAKLDAELKNPLYAIGGLAAKLETFKLTAYQKRITNGIWADWKVTTDIHGRVLWEWSTIHFRSESSGFKQLETVD